MRLEALLCSLLLIACNKPHQRVDAPRAQPSPDRAAAPARESADAPTGAKRYGTEDEPAWVRATPGSPLRPEEPGGLLPVRNASGHSSDEPPRPEALTLPEGFSISVYAREVPNARSLARGERGTLFVSTRRDEHVYAVVDRDGDYEVDQVSKVATDLDTPNGIAYRDGSLYIAEIERLLRLDGVDEELDKPRKPVVVREDFPDESHHGWRYLRFGPDGMLYMAVGAPCNVCLRDEPIFASITRMKPEGGPIEIYASGVRNSVGYDFHPQTKELWFTENGRDKLGDDLPPDELNVAANKGKHFGFPHCHGGVIVDPELGEGHPCTEYEPPVQQLGPHVAALGMRFYTGSMFPERYRNAIILAEHGSWNREEKIGYRVMVVRLDGRRAISYEPLVTGFLDPASGDVRGRPVDVEVLEDGSLIVSDDFTGTLYRVTYGD